MVTLDDYTDAKLGKLVKEAAGIREQEAAKQTSATKGAVIGGAAVGMVVAGPIGAAIGGALGALLSRRDT